MVFSEFKTIQDMATMSGYQTVREQLSLNYALRCYRNSSLAEDCPTFPRKNLAFNFTRNIACPFPGGKRICRDPNIAVRLDSGYINSHSDLGINAAPQNRFLYRSVLECAPLLNEGYTRRITPKGNSSLLPVISYLYGPTTTYRNTTYQYFEDNTINNTRGSLYYGISDYMVWYVKNHR